MERPSQTIAVATNATDVADTIFFWKTNELPYGCLAQWYSSHFRDTGVHATHVFNCAEQYMMYQKALILATADAESVDEDTGSVPQRSHGKGTKKSAQPPKAWIANAQNKAAQLPKMILAEKKPGTQKALARSVQLTPEQFKKWESTKFDVVVRGNYCKFTQNQDLLQLLLATGERELVEASPLDDIWGIGHAADNAEAHREAWGANLLGKALMRVRSQLRAEMQQQTDDKDALTTEKEGGVST